MWSGIGLQQGKIQVVKNYFYLQLKYMFASGGCNLFIEYMLYL